MSTPQQVLQKDIAADEKAIRLLIGEQAALSSKLARTRARLKLEQGKLAALARSKKPAKKATLSVASRFPDVSAWEPNINLNLTRTAGSIRVGDTFVTKLTEGTGFVDHLGAVRVRDALRLGFKNVGVYAFLHPSVNGTAQAQHLLSALGSQKPNIIIADLEVSDGAGGAAVRACAASFAAETRKHFGGKLWLYGGGPFLRDNGVPLTGYDAHWLAAYVSNPAPFMVYGKSKTVAWQYTDGQFGPNPHSCPGIGACDLSIIL